MIMNKTSIKHHIKHLEEQHRELDQKIKIEYIKYGNDSLVNSMKKQKLHLKDEIQNFRKQLETI
jgi:uncharacterized protein YdcH (DUF465 family)